ncbi:hypothetical protein IGI04_010251 [Brassica rapa subsp. trilocularis]|uniref:Cystatin domain-containing protein n=1 Tax=Brassica rapa subsp. trilocularis TaxID=1813537 RepID=A0ABQ7MZN3_BRACM|nr:hypothetical protein IGI04_010251 [Brassica rapa subsp. trilocularis]
MKNNNSSSSIKNQPCNKKPTILLLLLSLLTTSLFLLRLSQNKTILITTITSDSDHHHRDRHDSCLGRYIYIHNLPSRFNTDILQDCESISRPKDKISMCKYLDNYGFGPRIGDDGVSSDSRYSPSWYATNQFMLEVIFHEKIKRYECLTRNSSLASAFYIPYYAGLDFRRNLRRRNVAERDAAGKEMFEWLKKQPQWKGMSGKDHFLVTGRISRDFRRNPDNNSLWGTNLMILPESQNLSFLTIERSPTSHNEFAIPYPTYFHPTSTVEIRQWQDKIKLTNRTILFSFAGAQRPSRSQNGLVRSQVIEQCKSSSKTCRFLDCDVKANGCDDPMSLMKLFESSVFCLQPPGDSLTRRSVFDSILAGCIPVFSNQGSAYKQYVWHLPNNDGEYSVYIPVKELRTGGKSKIEEILQGIPNEKVIDMRENVIRLVPNIVYTKPNRYKPDRETFEDAFDVAVKGVIKRIEEKRREIQDFMKLNNVKMLNILIKSKMKGRRDFCSGFPLRLYGQFLEMLVEKVQNSIVKDDLDITNLRSKLIAYMAWGNVWTIVEHLRVSSHNISLQGQTKSNLCLLNKSLNTEWPKLSDKRTSTPRRCKIVQYMALINQLVSKTTIQLLYFRIEWSFPRRGKKGRSNMSQVYLKLSLLGLLVVAVVTPSANAIRKSVVLGGKSDVPNVQTNMEVQELGRYCVEQFNLHEQSGKGNVASSIERAVLNPLTFSRVVSAQQQVVAGLKYYLRIEVTQPDGTNRMFDSVVVVQPWLHSKTLLGFTPVATPIY